MVENAPVVLRVNGRDVPLPGTAPTATLLQALRAQGLVGTKEGCGDGDCGACTVTVGPSRSDGPPVVGDGPADGTGHRAVNSCLVPVGSVVGLDVLTVEGVAAPGRDGALHPVQQAMVDCAGSQCGYCTPGFVMSMFAGYHDPAERGPGGLDESVVEGNLCRCTGYASIRRACHRLADVAVADETVVGEAVPDEAGADERVVGAGAGPDGDERPAAASADAVSVRAEGRSFHRPVDLAAALDLLAAHPGAMLLAGGTDLGLELSHRRVDPDVVVSLEAVAELQQLVDTGTHLQVGAGVTLTRLEREAAGRLPVLDEMVRWFAARQVRNRATLGGNLGTASPIGDLLPVLLALDAELVLASREGRRTVPVADFFTGYRLTVRRPEEVVVRVDLPLGLAEGAASRVTQAYKVGKRGTDDISIVAAAYVLDLDRDGLVVHARLAYGGVAATPVRALRAEQALLGRRLDPEVVAEVAAGLREELDPLDDLRGSARYRRRLVGTLFEKLCAEHAAPAGRATQGVPA